MPRIARAEPDGAYLTESLMAALTRLLPERDPHPNLYEVTLFVLGFLGEREVWPAIGSCVELSIATAGALAEHRSPGWHGAL